MSHPVKRQEDLLHALTFLAPSLPPLRMVFVGEGSRKPYLEQLSQALGLADRVHFLGLRTDVPVLVGRCRKHWTTLL
jgi:glycosyltransferase involved in cell wall biosynthesis